MKLHKVTIKLNSSIITPIKGDTLWGHVVWGIANHEGDNAVAKFLEQQKTSPNFIVSSAFPKGAICKPLYKPEPHKENLTIEDYVKIKTAKKEKYTQNKTFKQTFTMHNTIDRETNSVLESGLYSTEEMWIEENEFDIYIRTDFENNRILELLEWAFENGFGKDASTGKGKIKILKSELLTDKPHTGKYVALAPFAFNSPKKLNNLRAEIFVREGKVGGAFATYLSPFKKSILLFDEGAVFESETELKFIGELLTDIHARRQKNLQLRICTCAANLGESKMKLTITPLTAVHIGTGEELTPLDYKLVSVEDGTTRFCKFSNDRILDRIASLNPNIPTDIKELQKFFHKECKEEDIEYRCKITKQFKEIHEANSKKDPLQNAAKVLEIYRNKNNFAPIIPGSSIKGAIRTAVLDKAGKDREDDADNKLFRSLAIADCEFPSESTVVGAMQILNKSGKKEAEKMQILADVILGNCIEGRDFSGKTDFTLYENFSEHLDFNLIRKKCNEFYLREFGEEYKKFYINKNGEEYKIMKLLEKILMEQKSKENSFIIRLGRWSQVEFVTFQTRKPFTRKGKDGKPLPFGKTRTVFSYSNCFIPMGWCVCSIAP